MERTLILLKPGGFAMYSEVYKMIERTVEANGFKVIKESFQILGIERGLALYRTHEGQWYHHLLAKQVGGNNCFSVVIEGDDAVAIIKRLVGPTKPEEAKSEVPGSIRGQFVIDNYAKRKAKHEVVDNICHASGTVAEAEWEIGVVFPDLQSA